MPGGGGLHPLLQPVEGGQVLRKGKVQQGGDYRAFKLWHEGVAHMDTALNFR